MKVLMIEDEADFIQRVQDVFRDIQDAELLVSKDVGLDDEEFNHDGGDSIEDQLRERLKKIVEDNGIDLVLLDTDLSRERGLRTQTEYRYAFKYVGLPVCRYRKKARQSPAQNLELSHKLAIDGATAIMVPQDAVTHEGPEEKLVEWLRHIHVGFSTLSEALEKHPKLLQDTLGPAGILASVLGKESLHADLLGYTSQNSLFFGGTQDVGGQGGDDRKKMFSTRLGYWLVNYIFAFPGPILHEGAAAAYLNLTPESFAKVELRDAIRAALYDGPFNELEGAHYWLEDLSNLLEELGGDIANSPGLKGIALQRVDNSQYGEAFYCMATLKPIPASEAATSPDWIPSGARLAKIRQEDLDQLGPMLNI